MFKYKALLLSFFALALTIVPQQALAAEQVISSFVRDDCSHCQDQEAFFEQELEKAYPELEIRYYDITEAENKELFDAVTTKYELVKGTPVTMVQDTLFQGFDTAETTGERYKAILDAPERTPISFEDARGEKEAQVASLLGAQSTCDADLPCEIERPSYEVTVPLIGKRIDVGQYSLGAMSLVLGLVDGFNPCALWVLIMFLVVLTQLKDKKKMWQYAGIFILAEAVMYYGILTVWLTAWDFIGLNQIVTPLIGLLALGSGTYFVYKFATYKPVCTVASPEQQKKISQKVKDLAAKPMTIGVFFGILALAFSVNVFEFACSIGIPQTFTKILELNALDWMTTQFYMLLYILMYMFDDVIVFGIALWSMEHIGVTHKYSKWATLIGGLFMLLLGVIMLWRPELLVF